MKNLWKMTLIAATLLLSACGGNNNKNTTEPLESMEQEVEATADADDGFSLERAADSPVAYEVLQLMLQNGQSGSDKQMAVFLEGRKNYQGATTLEFDMPRPEGNVTFYKYDDDYEDYWTVKCYPRKEGGWFVFAEVFYILGDWGPCQYFAYNYVDGQLTPAYELLPNPKFNDIYNDPEMLKGLSEERIAHLKQIMDGNDTVSGVLNLDSYDYFFDIYDAPFVVLLGCQSMAMNDAYFDNNEFRFAKTVYFWDGEHLQKICPVEGFAYGDCTEGDEFNYLWNEEEGRFVPVRC